MNLLSLADKLREKEISFSLKNASGNPKVSDVFADSRKVAPGSVFCCLKGEKSDGHQFISAAEKSGAAALVCEQPVETSLPVIQVESSREIMGELAASVYGEPASKLLMLGVTGTNGKTTTTYILRSILKAAGTQTGLLGTIIESDGVSERDAERTTPESCDIQRQLAAMVKNGCGACVMETSSHGLQMGRLNGCRFDAAVFTNLNPEHLDYHGDMETYFQAKRLLFSNYAKRGCVMACNADDPYGARLLRDFPGARGFSLSDAAGVRLEMDGASFRIETKNYPALSVQSPLTGMFNVANALAAAAAMRERLNDSAIAGGISSVPQVPGRLERYVLPNGACCIIDFAHTPAALRNVLSAVRGFCKGELISIFGHGGGRYQSNRPALGAIAAELADRIIVTMDNPRDEDPASIAESIVEGIETRNRDQKKDTAYQVVLDRKEAVVTALRSAGPNDVVVVSGKGPEKFLTIKDQKIPYSDAGAVGEWLQSVR